MILRKPYAFLIKHFKLIHIILTILLSYVFYKTMGVLTFFNDYINAGQMTTIVGGNAYLFSSFLFVSILISIVLALIVSVLMFNKKKPLLYYFVLIGFYLACLIFLLYTQGQVKVLEQELLDVRIIRMIRDVLVALVSIQFILIILSLIRGVGFDFKKFNFKEDLEELDVSEEDREEIEVALNIDTDIHKTQLKKRIRYIKYNIIENKNLLIIISLGVIAVLIISGAVVLLKKDNIYNQGTYISPIYYTLKIKNTYLTQKNYLSANINDKNFLILDIEAKKNVDDKKVLEKARMAINAEGYLIYPTYDYNGYFKDIGYEYNDYELDKEFNSYLMVYEIPKQFLDKEIYFEYYDINDKQYKIKLNYINLDLIKSEKEIELNKEFSFDKSILEDTKIKLSNIEINDIFNIKYNLCVSDNECYNYYENIYPDLSSNYDRTIIKIDADLNVSDSYYKKLPLGTFITYFGNIYYKYNGKTYKGDLKQIIPKKVSTKSVFFSVNNNIKKADNIYFELNVRNYKYTYKIK